jgi:hypothetical protein
MALGASIASRITDIIGSEYSTVPDLSYKDLINSAFNEVVDMVSEDLLLKYSKTPGVLQSNSEWLVEDRKILKVTRVDSDTGGIERECNPVDRQTFAMAGDSGSIYYATVHSPIYHFDSENDGAATLKILPEPGSTQRGKIWYFSYATNSTDLSAITYATLNTSHYLPGTLIHSIVLKSCINILNAYISNFIQDDEDTELAQLVGTQIQSLQTSFEKEMARFTDPEKPSGAE